MAIPLFIIGSASMTTLGVNALSTGQAEWGAFELGAAVFCILGFFWELLGNIEKAIREN